MKRDMDLIRKILMALEDSPEFGSWVEMEFDEYNPDQVNYHLMLLAEAGLIEVDDVSSLGETEYKAKWLTWEGHEFLDMARDESHWRKAKETVIKKSGGLAFDLLKSVLAETLKQALFPKP